ncbi:MAG: hypothetical protein GY710_15735, partial [Desulfobacteraceae bacterium]|nr:hypothetical protein [Desulfobacteraceae bacterium]
RIAFCPNNKQPISQRVKNETILTKFNRSHCDVCSLRAKCPVKDSKKNTYIRYNLKDFRLARRRQYEKTPAFVKKYTFRAGVEATMSEYKRITGVNKLRVRGLKPVAFAATLKALGINILRSVKAYNRRTIPPRTPLSSQSSSYFYSMTLFRISVFFQSMLFKLRLIWTEILKTGFYPNICYSSQFGTEFSFFKSEACFSF